ncbi:hypothetical protein GF362_01525 [Candidatus Dojkabacteria bacterium]|nr:hypothetical protein [Candidatus Dojkabacteria bacterium]
MESEGELNIIHHEKGDFLEETIGKLLAVPFQHLTSGTLSSAFKRIPPESVERLKKTFEDVEWEGDIEVHLNHSPLFRQLKRLFEKERRASLFSRIVVGLPLTVATNIFSKLTNANNYNPYTETVQLFNENIYTNITGVALAEEIDQTEEPIKREVKSLLTTIPYFLSSIVNWKAKERAMQHLSPEERNEAFQYLATGSVNDIIIDSLTLFGVLAGISTFLPDFDLSTEAELGIAGATAAGIYGYTQLIREPDELGSSIFFDPNKEILLEKNKKKKMKDREVFSLDVSI